MLTASLFCLLCCMLHVTCEFSVTVSTDERPYTDFLNHKLGESVESYCEANILNIQKTAERNCTIHRWFYEPRTKELICVCNVSDVPDTDGRLLMEDGNSRGILSISEDKFKESYALEIWTESDANQTARNLFLHVAHNEIQVFCDSEPSQKHKYFCAIVHYNNENVAWEYPENWIGPTRYLRNIFYDERKITVQVIGMHWPPKDSVDGGQFHIDTVVAGEEKTPDFCRLFSEKHLRNCRVEFVERAATMQLKHIAKLNLIMNNPYLIWKTNARRAYEVANQWKRNKEHCIFPVYMREDTASYVPSHTTAIDRDFDLWVTYGNAAIPSEFTELKQKDKICERIIKISNYTIKTCNVIETEYGIGVASVSVPSKERSVYEAQYQLMLQLNSKYTKKCLFNVTPNSIKKGY